MQIDDQKTLIQEIENKGNYTKILEKLFSVSSSKRDKIIEKY